MTRLTERQAWLTIAEAYATKRKDRTEFQKALLSLPGCCIAIMYLRGRKHISQSTLIGMEDKIEDCLKVDQTYFCSIKNDILRADFCYLMAYACEDE